MTEKPNLSVLPKGWVWARIGEVFNLCAGDPAPQGTEYFSQGTYPFVRVQDMGNLRGSVYLRDTKDHVNDVAAGRLRLFPKGSVLFTKSGMSILLNQRAILARDMYVVSHIGIARPLATLPNEWLYYWLSTIDFKDLTHATTLPSLQLSKVHEVDVPLPPLPEQHRIVAKIEELFTRLDAGVQALNKVKLQLKRYRQAVLKAAFEGKLTEDWRKAHRGKLEPASVLLEGIRQERKKAARFKELPALDTSALPVLPEGWAWTTLGELSEVSIGGTPSRRAPEYWNGNLAWVSSGEVANCRISRTKETITELGCQNSNAKLRPPGTVLLAMIGEGKTRGQTAILNIPAATNQNVASVACAAPPMIPSYVFYWLRARYSETRRTGSGDMQPALNSERVRGLTIPVCSREEQQRIVEAIERDISIEDEIRDTVDLSLAEAERLRQAILKTAFQGKLVPQDPHDEPADKLLERIKAEKAKLAAASKTTGKSFRKRKTA